MVIPWRFAEKNIELNMYEKVDFLQIRHFFIAEMRKSFLQKLYKTDDLLHRQNP